jgi:hypothetical protein
MADSQKETTGSPLNLGTLIGIFVFYNVVGDLVVGFFLRASPKPNLNATPIFFMVLLLSAICTAFVARKYERRRQNQS